MINQSCRNMKVFQCVENRGCLAPAVSVFKTHVTPTRLPPPPPTISMCSVNISKTDCFFLKHSYDISQVQVAVIYTQICSRHRNYFASMNDKIWEKNSTFPFLYLDSEYHSIYTFSWVVRTAYAKNERPLSGLLCKGASESVVMWKVKTYSFIVVGFFRDKKSVGVVIFFCLFSIILLAFKIWWLRQGVPDLCTRKAAASKQGIIATKPISQIERIFP